MLLVAYICLVIGASDMRNNTWVDSFNTAMILFILFFIPFVFPIGVIVFGSAIGRLASSREKRICPRCGKQIDPHALFCKFCGAELKQ
jgi:Na+/proline symporter